MMQGLIKLGILILLLATISFIFLSFLGFLLPVAVMVGGMLILGIIFFSVILAILAVLLAIYYSITKKPKIEKHGSWGLERVKGKGE